MQIQLIQSKIFELRNKRVMMDFHLAELYEVETRTLKQAVKRNLTRFPDDFMFQLTKPEWNELITNCDKLPENIKHNPGTPLAFTEQGVAMLASILRSKKAIEVNILIVRAFVLLRQNYMDYKELKQQINAIENEMNLKFKDINEALKYLLNPINPPRKPIGYKIKKNNG
jgi:hypothetical protein